MKILLYYYYCYNQFWPGYFQFFVKLKEKLINNPYFIFDQALGLALQNIKFDL